MHYSPARIYELRRQAIDEIDLDFLPDIEQCAYFKSNRNENY